MSANGTVRSLSDKFSGISSRRGREYQPSLFGAPSEPKALNVNA